MRPSVPNSIARRRDELTRAGLELTDLTDTNPTRHGLSNHAIAEIMARHAVRASRYEPSPRGPWPARAALAERFGGDPDDYWLTASTSEAYGWLFTLLADPGDAVAVPQPGYPLIEPLARMHCLSTVAYGSYYVHPSGWELDREALENMLSGRGQTGRFQFADKRDGSSPRTKGTDPAPSGPLRAVVVVNPNNPTGAYADSALLDVATEHGLPLIADEVFFPFQLAPPPEPARRLSGSGETVTFGLDGLSKLLAAPQLKLGWIRLSGPGTATNEVGRALDEIADTYLSVNTAVALALPDLLGLADASVARITARLTNNLSVAKRVLEPLRIRTVYGGWMMLVDVPPLMDADDLCLALMERAGLFVHPGYFYDLPDATLAVSLLPEGPVFEESCVRLAAAIAVFSGD